MRCVNSKPWLVDLNVMLCRVLCFHWRARLRVMGLKPGIALCKHALE